MCAGHAGQRAGGNWGAARGMSPTGNRGARSYSGHMDPARPLRDLFADLVSDESARQAHAADPEGFLEAHGHAALPADLVDEAIVNFADTAPPDVAEHLAPFVMAHSPVPFDEDSLPGDAHDVAGLDLLATAPTDALDLAVDPDAGDGQAVHHATGDDLAGHDLVGHDLVGHDLAGHDLAGHDLAADDLGGHDLVHAGDGLADPFDLDFGHGDFADAAEAIHIGQPDVDGTTELAQDESVHDLPVEHAPDLAAGALDEPGIADHGSVLADHALDVDDHEPPDDGGPHDA
jgi:hypothetical protein